MREAIGGTWIFGIVVVFIVLFTSYLAISVNYSKAFKVKNGVLSIIEKNEGLNSDAISAYLNESGYAVYGNCDTSISADEANQGVVMKKGEDPSGTTTSTRPKYKYCVTKTSVNSAISDSVTALNKSYYKVTVFFRLDLPVIGNIFTFAVSGETNAIYYANDR